MIILSSHAKEQIEDRNIAVAWIEAVCAAPERIVVFIGELVGVRVTFHGVRGSTPCHGDDIKRYGGNTSCVSLAIPGQRPIMFDLGTGARYFGATQPHDGSFNGVCLVSHLHWDHIQGLPFFTPDAAAGFTT